MRSLAIVSMALGSAGLVIVGAAWLGGRTVRWRLGFAAAAVLAYAAVLGARPDSLLVSDAAVVVFAVGLAPLLARSMGSIAALVAFAITASIVDLISFGGGLTRRIIQDFGSGGSDLLQFLAFTVPVAGRATPLAGVVDLLLSGALFCALVEIHGNRPRAGATVLAALALAVVVGLTVGGVAAVPFLGFAAVADAWLAKGRRDSARGSVQS